MEIRNGGKIAAWMFILAALSCFAACMGVFDNALYFDVYRAGTIPRALIWGAQAQDIVSIPFALLLAGSTLAFLKRRSLKFYILMLALDWYFFYAFGLYAMQGQYTSIYLVYLAIFGLSFYGLLFGVLSIDRQAAARYRLPERLQKAIGVFFLVMIGLLYPAWILRMLPDIAGHIPGSTYAVFVLDLSLVFPAIGMIAYLLLKRKPLGDVLAGVALFKIFALCLSWAFAEISNPFVGNEFTTETALISFLLTAGSLALLVPYFIKLKRDDDAAGRQRASR